MAEYTGFNCSRCTKPIFADQPHRETAQDRYWSPDLAHDACLRLKTQSQQWTVSKENDQ